MIGGSTLFWCARSNKLPFPTYARNHWLRDSPYVPGEYSEQLVMARTKVKDRAPLLLAVILKPGGAAKHKFAIRIDMGNSWRLRGNKKRTTNLNAIDREAARQAIDQD